MIDRNWFPRTMRKMMPLESVHRQRGARWIQHSSSDAHQIITSIQWSCCGYIYYVHQTQSVGGGWSNCGSVSQPPPRRDKFNSHFAHLLSIKTQRMNITAQHDPAFVPNLSVSPAHRLLVDHQSVAEAIVKLTFRTGRLLSNYSNKSRHKKQFSPQIMSSARNRRPTDKDWL